MIIHTTLQIKVGVVNLDHFHVVFSFLDGHLQLVVNYSNTCYGSLIGCVYSSDNKPFHFGKTSTTHQGGE